MRASSSGCPLSSVRVCAVQQTSCCRTQLMSLQGAAGQGAEGAGGSYGGSWSCSKPDQDAHAAHSCQGERRCANPCCEAARAARENCCACRPLTICSCRRAERGHPGTQARQLRGRRQLDGDPRGRDRQRRLRQAWQRLLTAAARWLLWQLPSCLRALCTPAGKHGHWYS